MSDYKDKMQQIVCRLELHPRPRWGSLQRSPRPPSWILGGLLLRGRERDERGREGKGEERRVGEERSGEGIGGGEGRGGEGWGGKGARSTPKLKLGPRNYFPGAGAAVLSVKATSLK